MNCGADIVAVTAWMSNEMNKMKALIAKAEGGAAAEGEEAKGAYT